MNSVQKPWTTGPLKVDGRKRYLVNGDKPFFWLGDTAWDLLQRLNLAESEVYLRNRAEKGFTVIQAVLVNFRPDGDSGSNQLVEEADILRCIGSENEPYWRHVDEVLKLAERLGIYLAFLPVWGKVVRSGYLHTGNAVEYATFLTKRYGGAPNVIWLLGGDIRGSEHFELWELFGNAMKERDAAHLMGYHPFGRTSTSYWFSESSWLDFNMFQSGHRRYDQNNLASWDDQAGKEPWNGEDNWRYAAADLAREPARPVVDGEPSYEQIPQGLHNPGEPRWQEHHVRRYAYWSVLAGSFGHTYGDNSIFQFYGTGHPQEFGAQDTWDQAIHHTGSGQMQILKDLMLEIDFQQGNPAPELLTDQGDREANIGLFQSQGTVVAYDYLGRSFTLRPLEREMDAWWLDPAAGSRSYFGRLCPGGEIHLTPPAKRQGQNDWVLLLKQVDKD